MKSNMTLHLLNAKLLDVEVEMYNRNVTVSLLIFSVHIIFLCVAFPGIY